MTLRFFYGSIFVEFFYFLGGLVMKALEEKILKDGTVLPGNILKVASFLNHQLDVDFIMEMGREIARIFKDEEIQNYIKIIKNDWKT